MVIANNSGLRKPRAAQLCAAAIVLLFVITGMVPLGSADAQDIDAVKERLAQSVVENEITFEHAAIMMEALKSYMHEREQWDHEHGDHEHGDHDDGDHDDGDHDDEDHEHGDHEHEDHEHEDHEHEDHEDHDHDGDEDDDRIRQFEAAAQRMHQAVESGRVSKEVAERTMIEMRKQLWPPRKNAEGHDHEHEDGEHGNHEHEDGEHRGDEHSSKAKHQANQREKFKQKIMKAVKSGHMTGEEARNAFRKFERKMKSGAGTRHDDSRKEEYQAIEMRLEELLDAGEITKEQAEQKLNRLRKQFWGDKDSDRDEDD